jgi:hypothetical protein
MQIYDIKIVWLKPDRLLILSNCWMQVVDIEINTMSFAYLLHRPQGIKCIVPDSIIDWEEDGLLSTFYAVNKGDQYSIVKLNLSL